MDDEIAQRVEWTERYEKRAMGTLPDLQGKVDEFLAERQNLEATLARKTSMITNKETRLEGLMSLDGVEARKRIQIITEMTRWREDIDALRTTLAELDTQMDRYERSIKAVKDENAKAGFGSGTRRCMTEIQEAEKYKEGAERVIKRAMTEMSELCKEQARLT